MKYIEYNWTFVAELALSLYTLIIEWCYKNAYFKDFVGARRHVSILETRELQALVAWSLCNIKSYSWLPH